jgi:hypothetical protein
MPPPVLAAGPTLRHAGLGRGGKWSFLTIYLVDGLFCQFIDTCGPSCQKFFMLLLLLRVVAPPRLTLHCYGGTRHLKRLP